MSLKNKSSKKQRKVTYDSVINDFIYRQIPKSKTCLDIGCWTGNLGKKLIQEKNCLVDGLDQDKGVLAIAKKVGFRHTYLFDLNFSGLDKLKEITQKYDVIICADVLEHLASPQKLLLSIKKNLKNNGAIYISVPNIAFVLYRLKLLLGQFDYNPKGGVMDETHLRFFTVNSIKNLCLNAGYKIEILQGYNLVKKKYRFLDLLSKISPEMFSLQFYLKLTQ